MTTLPHTNLRTNRLMREYVRLVVWCMDAGQISVHRAGQLLDAGGVPLEVAVRVLPKRRAA